MDTTGFAIAATAGNQTKSGFHSDPNSSNRIAVVYQHYRSDLDTTRAFRRRLTLAPATAPVVEAEDAVDAPTEGATGDATTAPSLAFRRCR